jgi:hypothetical protein
MSQTDAVIKTPEASAPPRDAIQANRRAFFAGALGAAAIGAVTLAPSATAQTTFTEVDALNLALNLEYLQANYFAFATNNAALAAADISGTGTLGAATGGRQVTFTDPVIASFAREMAADDLAHVRFLRSSLTTTYAVGQPAIDLGTGPTSAFSKLAQLAGIVGAGQSFDPYANDANFLLGAFMLKDVSVTAYAGIMGYVGTTLAYVEAIAGVLATEAHHAGTIRTALYRRGLTTASLIDATEAISNARDTLDGSASDLDQGIRPGTTDTGAVGANLAPLNSSGFLAPRTPQQVLNVLYLNSGTATSGGFFTSGTNGTIKSTATS